jgi:hypothetical protein
LRLFVPRVSGDPSNAAKRRDAAIHPESVKQALWYVAQALDTSGYNVTGTPIDPDEWREFIEAYGNMGAYLMSAHGSLREALDADRGNGDLPMWVGIVVLVILGMWITGWFGDEADD